jgi:uncharacterized membrane protein
MQHIEWDWIIRIGLVLAIAGVYYPLFYDFVNDLKNYPHYFLPFFYSIIAGIVITILLEKLSKRSK